MRLKLLDKTNSIAQYLAGHWGQGDKFDCRLHGDCRGLTATTVLRRAFIPKIGVDLIQIAV
jgi:hypothetical protein